MFVEVVLRDLSRTLDQLFTYAVPLDFQEKLTIGDRVVVPFGGGNRFMDGVVWRIFSEMPEFNTKDICAVLAVAYRMSPSQMTLIRSLRSRYGATYSQGLQCVLPSPYQLEVTTAYGTTDKTMGWGPIGELFLESDLLKVTTKTNLQKAIKSGEILKFPQFELKVVQRIEESITCLFDDLDRALDGIPASYVKRRRLLTHLFGVGQATLSDLTGATQATRKEVMALVDKGFARYEVMALSADFLNHSLPHHKESLPELTVDQSHVVSAFWAGKSRALLQGITGSGKTRVYLELAKRVLASGRQVLVLVPEISLTPQLVSRFASHLTDQIAVLHNKVHAKDKMDFFNRIGDGSIQVVIGARSAIFAPFKNLGLILIDEEHEGSFKSDRAPRYDARELALDLSHKLPCPILLGSASPSLDTRHLADLGGLDALSLTQRIGQATLPEVNLIDLRNTPQVAPLLTVPFLEALEETLARGEQAIILHNRKGFANYVQCHTCGHVEKCLNCDIPLTVYQQGAKLACHYCGYQKPVTAQKHVCSVCSGEVAYKGFGLEQVVTALRERYPMHEIVTLDADTVKVQENLIQTLEDFRTGKIQVLIGTQILAKGLDFPNVTFVGVLLADQMLNMPDYSAAERTMQLLLQVAGRAGRHGRKGQVFIQTYQPDHLVIQRVAAHNYDGFVGEEKRLRETLGYPPYGKLYGIRIVGEQAHIVKQQSERIYEFYVSIFKRHNISTQIFPPNPAYYGKIKNKYVFNVLLKGASKNHRQMIKMLYLGLVKNQYDIINTDCHVDFSINPTMMG